jgi:hypothetical protein
MNDSTEHAGPRERAGLAVGLTWAPAVAAISALRKSRMFHPRGVLATGRVFPSPYALDHVVAERIAGPALVRLSGALAKDEQQRFEVLGLGLRIGRRPIASVSPSDGDQDVLFATIVSPLTMPIAALSTRSDDFLANRYWGVAPFEVEGIGRVKLRLSPTMGASEPHAGRRREKLAHAIALGRARFSLDVRHTLHTQWEPLAILELDALCDLDQEALRFDPFRTGRGIVPVGFVHAIRKYVYAAGQAARPAHAL